VLVNAAVLVVAFAALSLIVIVVDRAVGYGGASRGVRKPRDPGQIRPVGMGTSSNYFPMKK
jgi:hypothetical protein